MATLTRSRLSALAEADVARTSPIREIMKMAERRNIVRLGLDPDDVISFGGGWVDHEAPEGLRQAYEEVVADPERFHRSGAYTATLGETACREAVARFESHLFGVPDLSGENVAIGTGSSQLTHDLFRALVDPGEAVMLLDPAYANYEGQLAWASPGAKIVRLPVLDPEAWAFLPDTDPERVLRDFHRLFDEHDPRLVVVGAPDNPTGQMLPHALVEAMAARTADAQSWLAIDFAYKCQTFRELPGYYAWSPADHPQVVSIHSNSKWARGLGRRLGWLEADPVVISAIERIQQCNILCPDTLSQMAMARYVEQAVEDGSLRAYVDETRERYRHAARVTVGAIDEHLGLPRLEPAGELYTVVKVGRDADPFASEALRATGVLVVPGRGFGPSLTQGVRLSYGPLVRTPDKIREGLERLGRWMRSGGA